MDVTFRLLEETNDFVQEFLKFARVASTSPRIRLPIAIVWADQKIVFSQTMGDWLRITRTSRVNDATVDTINNFGSSLHRHQTYAQSPKQTDLKHTNWSPPATSLGFTTHRHTVIAPGAE